MWIFGYGSLVWNPGFEYEESRVGYVKGYVRRFWQGNDFHRGNPTKLGRVATLVEENEGITWGRAFHVGEDSETSLNYLNCRESKLGGYSTTIVTFYPRDPRESPIPVVLYVALPTSRLYMGPAPIPQVAEEIADAEGSCGPNAEYLLRLAIFMREEVPDIWDEHLYHLEHLVRARLKEKNISADSLVSTRPCTPVRCILTKRNSTSSSSEDSDSEDGRWINRNQKSNDYASRIPTRKLKCVDL